MSLMSENFVKDPFIAIKSKKLNFLSFLGN